MSDGFGWSFYGFWIYAVLWVSGYFLWVRHVNRKERDKEPSARAQGEPQASLEASVDSLEPHRATGVGPRR